MMEAMASSPKRASGPAKRTSRSPAGGARRAGEPDGKAARPGGDSPAAGSGGAGGPSAETDGADRTDEGAVTSGEMALTIDELAATSGVPSRTIRYYQSKGTLGAPEKRGRVAYYGEEHLRRLRLIAELQDRGLRLDAIRDVLRQMASGGDSIQAWLGVGDQLQAPWSDEKPAVMTGDELQTRFGGNRPGLIAQLEGYELIRRESDSIPAVYLVPSPALLEIGARLDAAGIDLDTAVGAANIIRKRVGRAADDLVEYFTERAGRGFGRGGNPEAVLEAYEAVRPLGGEAVTRIFAQEMERALRSFVESGRAISGVPRDAGRSRSRSGGSRPHAGDGKAASRSPDRRHPDRRHRRPS